MCIPQAAWNRLLPPRKGGERQDDPGRVLDETKAGVPGATVIVKGSTRGVITGNDGTFSIDVKPTDVIEISYLGYETQSIPVGTKTNIVTRAGAQGFRTGGGNRSRIR